MQAKPHGQNCAFTISSTMKPLSICKLMGRRFKHCGHFEVLIWNGSRDWAIQGTLSHLLQVFVLWKEVMPWLASEPIRLRQSRLSMLRNLTSRTASWHQGCGTISRRWEGAWRIPRWVARSISPHFVRLLYFISFHSAYLCKTVPPTTERTPVKKTPVVQAGPTTQKSLLV